MTVGVKGLKNRKFLIIANEIVLFPIRSGTQPVNPSHSENSQVSYH